MEAHDEASKVATDYVTDSGGSGTKFHDVGTVSSDYVQVANGSLELVSNNVSRLKAYIENNVAKLLAGTDSGGNVLIDETSVNIRAGLANALSASASGVDIWSNGSKVASYGADAIIGQENSFHIKITSNELGFYEGQAKIAYINGNRLYISQSVVLQQMDVGTKVSDGGLGQWSWKVHDVNGSNNLYLKWLG